MDYLWTMVPYQLKSTRIVTPFGFAEQSLDNMDSTAPDTSISCKISQFIIMYGILYFSVRSYAEYVPEKATGC
jgi:hypothetical protein